MPGYVKVSGAWKQATTAPACYVKVNGAWKKCSQVYVKVNGAWKPCYSTTQSVTVNLPNPLPYATFNENSFSYNYPTWASTTLSNAVNGSTFTLYSNNVTTLYRSAVGDGGMDEGNYVPFDMTMVVNGAEITGVNGTQRLSYSKLSGTTWTIFGSSDGYNGYFSIDFKATSTTISITFKPSETIIRNATITYTKS